MRRLAVSWIVIVSLLAALDGFAAPRFEFRFPESVRAEPADGRLLLIVAPPGEREPRFRVSWRVSTAQLFGSDVERWSAGSVRTLDADAVGHPLHRLEEIPPGEYQVQAVLNLYETFERSDGHVVKLPPDRGEGQVWSRKPGNLYSEPATVDFSGDEIVRLDLDRVVPPIDPPVPTKYVRHMRMQSELLSEFWGRPVFLSAVVLVPEGFDDSPDARYPVVYNQGHFPSGISFFREEPPDDRGRGAYAHEFYQHWTSGRIPKMLVVLTQHATPYYDDSYGVNSANTGPYGDALVREFYPWLERELRGIGEPWARVLYGGSTGGWISLAQQIFYPDFFGGAWGLCPDPVDFHAFQLIDLYEDTDAYHDAGPFKKMPRPLGRSPDGSIFSTMEDFDRQEEALGSKSRSGGQWDAFHATFGPVADDGYPAPLWEPLTGKIDPEVAAYWREHYDLTAMLERRWNEIGPALVGKLHLTMGTKDTFYLEQAAYKMEAFLESTARPGNGPYYAGSFDWGDNEPHCYTGTPDVDGIHFHRYLLTRLAGHMRDHAPEGVDLHGFD